MDTKLAKTNFDYCRATIKLKNDVELSYLDLASRLYKIHAEKMYEPNYEDFQEFLDEIKVSKTNAYNLMTIWERFVIQFNFKPKLLADAGGHTVIAEILPYSDSKAKAIKWLRQATYSSRRDLRIMLKEASTGVDMSSCKHDNKVVITFTECETCGDRERVYDHENKQL